MRRMWPRAPERPGRSPVANATLRATALLRGGVPASRVWRVLGEEPGAPPELRVLAQRIAAGDSSVQALAAGDGPEWRVLAAAWQLAERSGAPVSATLERLAEALSSLDRLAERRSVLLSGPRATIRLVGALPIVALLCGALLGFDPIGVLWSPGGAILAVMGVGLLAAGVRWAQHLTDRLSAADWVSGLECELCWIALLGGAAHGDAVRRVADAVDGLGVEWVRLSSLCRDGTVQTAVRAAALLGVPAASMLLAEASASRARALAKLEREAERLGVRVLLPMGICVLPSFIVLGVLPVLFAVMGSLGPIV